MSSTDQSKPGGKSGQRSRKAKQQNKKPDQRQRAKPDQQPDLRQDERELVEAEIAPTETLPIAEEASTETFSIAAEALTDTSSNAATVVAAEPHSRGALVPIDAYPVAIVSIDAFFIGFQ